MDAGLVVDAPTPVVPKSKSAPAQEEDRRLFMLTKEGKSVLTAEVDRLQNVVRAARLRLREGSTGKA
jgi:hypothetical protein